MADSRGFSAKPTDPGAEGTSGRPTELATDSTNGSTLDSAASGPTSAEERPEVAVSRGETAGPTGQASDIPVFVDLDGTLTSTDLLYESLLLAAQRSPAILWKVPGWFLRGRAYLKGQLAQCAQPNVQLLPYRQEVVDFLAQQRAQGRKLVLATASDRQYAQAVASHLGLFDDVLASDGNQNLKGPGKLEAISQYCQQHGIQEFAYLGDSSADLAVWKHSAEVYAVAPSTPLRRQLANLPVKRTFPGSASSTILAGLRALRPRQWAKNLLLFVPLVLAHQWTSWPLWRSSILAFACFCAVASAVYLINDLCDVENDRQHPKKKKRPFASGALPLVWGPPAAMFLVVSGLTLSLVTLPALFTALLIVYLIVTSAYSGSLKRQPIIDVLVLAVLYTIRILAGGVATNLEVSRWLLAFAGFHFLSLAFAKRYAELARLLSEGNAAASGRGYRVGDLPLVGTLGATAGYIAVLVLALYVNNLEGTQPYLHPSLLWLTSGLLLYWISRIWLLAYRGELSEDPVVFAMTDVISWLIGVLSLILILVARFVEY